MSEINLAHLKFYLVQYSILPRASEIISFGMGSQVLVTCINFFTGLYVNTILMPKVECTVSCIVKVE